MIGREGDLGRGKNPEGKGLIWVGTNQPSQQILGLDWLCSEVG